MTTRGLVLTCILAVLAIASWYAGREAPVTERIGDNVPAVTSGYYLLDAVITGSNEAGQTTYRIEAGQATQAELGAPVTLQTVVVRYAGSGDSRWLIEADNATLSRDNQSLQMSGGVNASWDDPNDNHRLRMQTETLRFDTASEIVATDSTVSFEMGMGRLVATGMSASLANNTVELRSNIRGQFVP